MWKYIKPALGALLLLLAFQGTAHWISGAETTSGRDMEAVGVITRLDAKILRITPFAKKTDHYIGYSFKAHNGETYSKSFSISPEEYASLRKGQRIRVRYHSNNPSINAIDGFRHYTSSAEMAELNPNKHPAFRAVILLAFFAGGIMLLWSSFGGMLAPNTSSQRRSSKPQVVAKIPPARFGAARGGKAAVTGRSR